MGIASELTGQINLKIGYNTAMPNFEESDAILSSYMPENTELVQGFGRLKFIHGIQLGLRYQIGTTAFELGWENMNRSRTSLFYNSSTDSFTERSYKYGLAAYSFGMDNYFGDFGIGSVLKSQAIGIEREIGNNSLQVVNERNWNLRLHLIWVLQKSKSVSLVLQPFYQFSLGAYDLEPLAIELDVSDLETSMKPSVFGISLIFYNGKQTR